MIEVEVHGKTRGFIFGTYTLKIIRQETGVLTVEELWDKLFPNPEEGKGTSIEYLDFLTKFYYSCAKHYAISKKIEVDFTDAEVSDWLDDIGKDKALEVFAKLVNTYVEKNLKAPQTVGQEQQ